MDGEEATGMGGMVQAAEGSVLHRAKASFDLMRSKARELDALKAKGATPPPAAVGPQERQSGASTMNLVALADAILEAKTPVAEFDAAAAFAAAVDGRAAPASIATAAGREAMAADLRANTDKRTGKESFRAARILGALRDGKVPEAPWALVSDASKAALMEILGSASKGTEDASFRWKLAETMGRFRW